MMHVKFYAVSILFLVVVGTCFLLIAMEHGTDQGIAADNMPNSNIDHTQVIAVDIRDQVGEEVGEFHTILDDEIMRSGE